MPDLFFQCLFALLAIFGAVDLVRSVFLYAFRKSCPAGHYLMFSISGHDEQAELRLRCAVSHAARIGAETRVVCLDRGMDGETRRVCELFCGDHPAVILCTPEEFEKNWVR